MSLTPRMLGLLSIFSWFRDEQPTLPPSDAELEKNAFGRSLHVDLYHVPLDMDDLTFFAKLLEELVDRLGMHMQAPPYIFSSPEKEFPDKAGLSGWVPLIESGISIHTLRYKSFVSIDLYTCGGLDVEATLTFLKKKLKTDTLEWHYLIRGIKYYG